MRGRRGEEGEEGEEGTSVTTDPPAEVQEEASL